MFAALVAAAALTSGCAQYSPTTALATVSPNSSSNQSSSSAPGTSNTAPSAGGSPSTLNAATTPTPTPAPTPSPVRSPSPSPTPKPLPPASTPALTPTPVATPVPRASSDSDLTVCAAKTTPGTDVSDYDPGTQWLEVQHGGAGFAFIKATEGITLVNAQFAGDWPGAASAGVLRGAYHFYHPSDDPTQQAQFFLNTMGTLNANDLPAMLDWEVTDSVAPATQIANAQIWLNLVETATGKVPVIYTGPSFWNALGNPMQFARYPLFIAHYDVRCPSIPAPWSKWVFWQSGIGPVTGVADSSADQDAFSGTLAQLLLFAQTGAQP